MDDLQWKKPMNMHALAYFIEDPQPSLALDTNM